MTPALFDELPIAPKPLTDDERRMIETLPDIDVADTVQEIDEAELTICRRLERRGLVKIRYWLGGNERGGYRTPLAGRTVAGREAIEK